MCTRQARSGCVIELTEARLLRQQLENLLQRLPLALGRGSLRDERGDDDAPPRLVPFAEGLDPGPLFEVFVHDAPFLRAHRVHLDRDIALQRLLGSPIRPRRKHLAPALPVAGSIEHDPLAVPNPRNAAWKQRS